MSQYRITDTMLNAAQDALERTKWSPTGELYNSIAAIIAYGRAHLRDGRPLNSGTLSDGAAIMRAAEDCDLLVTIKQVLDPANNGLPNGRYRVFLNLPSVTGPAIEGTPGELAGMLAALAPTFRRIQHPDTEADQRDEARAADQP